MTAEAPFEAVPTELDFPKYEGVSWSFGRRITEELAVVVEAAPGFAVEAATLGVVALHAMLDEQGAASGQAAVHELGDERVVLAVRRVGP
jgi:hypothetical protein